MQVSDFPAILKADFGLFRPFSGLYRQYRPPADMADTARFWPNQPDSARIEPHRRESKKKKKKKKKPRRSPTRGQPRRTPRPASDAGAAPLVPRPCFLAYQIIYFGEREREIPNEEFFMNLKIW